MNRLWVRLATAFVLVTWAVLAIVAVVVYRSVESSFIQYVRERDAAILGSDWIDDLANYYAATGAWAGKTHQIAVRINGAWEYHPPKVGWLCYIEDEAKLSAYKSTGWSAGIAI